VRRPLITPHRRRRAKSLEQKRRVREAIIAAGRRVFVETEAGLADASLRRIAAIAGYSHSVMYEYFRDKQALLLAIREIDLAAHADALERTAARTKDPEQRVRAVFLKGLHYWNQHYDQFEVVFGVRPGRGVARPAADSAFAQSPAVARAYRACQEPIRELFKTYPRPPLSVKQATDTMIAAIAGVIFIPRQVPIPWTGSVAMGKWVINTLLAQWQQLASRGASTRDGRKVAADDQAADAGRQPEPGGG
jgi:AcrR family transcriptional regulator